MPQLFALRPPAIAAIPLMIAAMTQPAAACTLRAPWEINDPLMIPFMGSPLPDTVLAGNGALNPIVAMGHSGRGAPRVAYGQRVRVDRVGELARRALPRNTREVVLVPWDYASDCRPVAWARSARWLPDSLSGLFRGRLRPRAEWAQGIPTFDISTTQFQPYRDGVPGVAEIFRGSSRAPRLSTQTLLDFYDALPAPAITQDTLAALRWLATTRADTALADKYPVDAFIHAVRYQFRNTRAKDLRVPMAGTHKLTVSIDSLPPRTLYLRVASTVTSLQDSMRGTPDTAQVPRLPEGYYAYAAADTSIDRLPLQCIGSPNSNVSYIDLDWHTPLAADGTGEWKSGIDERLLDVLLSNEERDRWRTRRREASAAMFDSLQNLSDSVRTQSQNRPFIFIPNRPLRVSQDTVGPMRINGTMNIPLLGALHIRGERVSRVSLQCDM